MHLSSPTRHLSPSPHTSKGAPPNGPQDTHSRAAGPDHRRAWQCGTSAHHHPTQSSAAAEGPVLSAEGTGGMLLGSGFRSLARGMAQMVASASGQTSSKCPESSGHPVCQPGLGLSPGWRAGSAPGHPGPTVANHPTLELPAIITALGLCPPAGPRLPARSAGGCQRPAPSPQPGPAAHSPAGR